MGWKCIQHSSRWPLHRQAKRPQEPPQRARLTWALWPAKRRCWLNPNLQSQDLSGSVPLSWPCIWVAFPQLPHAGTEGGGSSNETSQVRGHPSAKAKHSGCVMERAHWGASGSHRARPSSSGFLCQHLCTFSQQSQHCTDEETGPEKRNDLSKVQHTLAVSKLQTPCSWPGTPTPLCHQENLGGESGVRDLALPINQAQAPLRSLPCPGRWPGNVLPGAGPGLASSLVAMFRVNTPDQQASKLEAP